jgi:hypothetical protein
MGVEADVFPEPGPFVHRPRCDVAVRTFRCKGYDLHFVGLVDVDDFWDLSDPSKAPHSPPPSAWQPKEHDGPWEVFEVVVDDRTWQISAYRKRINFSTRIRSGPRDSDKIEREIFALIKQFPQVREHFENWLSSLESSPKFVYFPLTSVWDYRIAPNFWERALHRLKPLACRSRSGDSVPSNGWLTDRTTTFSYRLFDSSRPHKSVYVRISRHVVICYGVSTPVLQEVFNLIHERILYTLAKKLKKDPIPIHERFLYALARKVKKNPSRSADDYYLLLGPEEVFSLTDAFTRTTVLTELNLLLYETAARVAIVAVLSTAFLAFLSQFFDNVPHRIVRTLDKLPWWLGSHPHAIWMVLLLVLWSAFTGFMLWIAPRASQYVRIYRHE